MMAVDKALAMADNPCVRANYDIYVLAAEVRRLRSEIDSARDDLQSFVDARNEWKQRAEAAEAALKEAQEQEPVVFFPCDWKPTRGSGVIGSIHADALFKVPLYARPVPAAPAVAAPAVSDATCKQCLQVDRELHEVIAGLVAIAEKKGKRQGSPNHCHSRPGIWDEDNIRTGLAGKPCAECAMYDRARSLLATVKDSLTAQADCRACVNRGRVNGLSQESYCDSCVYEGRGWRQNHFVDAAADRLLENES